MIFQNYGIAGNGQLASASQSTINNLAPDDSSFVTISPTDLDLKTGGSRGAEVNKFYCFLGYQTSTFRLVNFFTGLGGSIEFPESNTAFKQFTVWYKVGCQF